MKHFLFTIIVLVSALAYPQEYLPKVLSENGNIYYSQNGDTKIQLTHSGNDRAPVLSPNGSIAAFIRKSNEQANVIIGNENDYSPEDILADQIWVTFIGNKPRPLYKNEYQVRATRAELTPTSGSGIFYKGRGKKEKMVIKDKISDNPKKSIGHILDNSIQFSPDSKKIYFITSAWVTTGAVHCVNIDGSNEHFVTDSNYIKVIDKGQYKGNLIINQHRYFVTGGSYNWFWLFSPNGKEIGPIGDNLDQCRHDSLFD